MSNPNPPLVEARPDPNDTKGEVPVLKDPALKDPTTKDPTARDSTAKDSVLRDPVEIFESAQKESNQTVRTACMMVLGIAIALIGWNVARGIWADSEKAALRHDLEQFIQSEINGSRVALESNIASRLASAETNLLRTVVQYTNVLQSLADQVSTANNNVLHLGAIDRLRQADGFLYTIETRINE